MPKLPPPPRSAQKRSGFVSGSARTTLAVGGHDLGREDAGRGQAVLARQPADPAAERVADDADVVGGAVERGQPVRDGGRDDVGPDRAGGDARDAGAAGRPRPRSCATCSTSIVPWSEPAGRAVARALHRDPEAELARVFDCCDDVVDRLRQRDDGGALVDGEVPGAAGLVPARAHPGRRGRPGTRWCGTGCG